MPYTTIFTHIYQQQAKHFVTTFMKTPHIYEKMTIWPRNSTKETVWVNTEESRTVPCEIFSAPIDMHCFTLLLQCPKQLRKTSNASLFDLLPSEFLADIDIWLFGLEHRVKFKHVISRFKSMCNPIIFAIPHNLLTPYHYFGALRK